ncbi:MAG: ParB N-terminal domain-containing protein [Lachnospiraceae bacterium]|nr:ParB N-terminal domain-containing protein [Lachnospiraceae bacterium]
MKQQMRFGKSGNEVDTLLQKIENQDTLDVQLIPYDDIEPNKKNDYPISDIEGLADDIRKSNYLKPMGVIKNPIGSPKKYRLFDGERRWTAAGYILANDPDFPLFKKGLPCYIKDSSIDPLDEEILIILANKERDMTPEQKREKALRLATLYEEKNQSAPPAEQINVSKQLSKDLGIGARQAERYTAVNNKLLPELKEAFSSAAMNLEDAASIANMDESAQRMILALIDKKQKIGKDTITQVQAQHSKLIEKLQTLEHTLADKNNEISNLEDSLSEMKNNLQLKTSEMETAKETLRKELEASDPNKQLVEQLQHQLQALQHERDQMSQTLTDEQKKKADAEKEIKALNKKLADAQNKPEKALSQAEKKAIEEKIALETMCKDLEKRITEFSLKYQKYKSNDSFEKIDIASLTAKIELALNQLR